MSGEPFPAGFAAAAGFAGFLDISNCSSYLCRDKTLETVYK
jgi:hypothetical protein